MTPRAVQKSAQGQDSGDVKNTSKHVFFSCFTHPAPTRRDVPQDSPRASTERRKSAEERSKSAEGHPKNTQMHPKSPVRGHFRSPGAPRPTHMHPDKVPRSNPGVPLGRSRRSQAVQNDAKSLSKERPRARQWICEKHVKTRFFLVFYALQPARGGPNAKRCTPRFTQGEYRATQEC